VTASVGNEALPTCVARELPKLSLADDVARAETPALLRHAPDDAQPERLAQPFEFVQRAREGLVRDALELNADQHRGRAIDFGNVARGGAAHAEQACSI